MATKSIKKPTIKTQPKIKPIVLDIETTGLDPFRHELYEISYGKIGTKSGTVSDIKTMFVKPTRAFGTATKLSQLRESESLSKWTIANLFKSQNTHANYAREVLDAREIDSRALELELKKVFKGKQVWIQNLEFERAFLFEKTKSKIWRQTGLANEAATKYTNLFEQGGLMGWGKQFRALSPELKAKAGAEARSLFSTFRKAYETGAKGVFDIKGLTQTVFGMAATAPTPYYKPFEFQTGIGVEVFTKYFLDKPEIHIGFEDIKQEGKMLSEMMSMGTKLEAGKPLTIKQAGFFKHLEKQYPTLRKAAMERRLTKMEESFKYTGKEYKKWLGIGEPLYGQAKSLEEARALYTKNIATEGPEAVKILKETLASKTKKSKMVGAGMEEAARITSRIKRGFSSIKSPAKYVLPAIALGGIYGLYQAKKSNRERGYV